MASAPEGSHDRVALLDREVTVGVAPLEVEVDGRRAEGVRGVSAENEARASREPVRRRLAQPVQTLRDDGAGVKAVGPFKGECVVNEFQEAGVGRDGPTG